MFWDESNRLRVVYDQNSYQMQHYIYDAAGERTLKASSKIENVYENGQVEANTTTMGLYPPAAARILSRGSISNHGSSHMN